MFGKKNENKYMQKDDTYTVIHTTFKKSDCYLFINKFYIFFVL